MSLEKQDALEQLKHIRSMMEHSSRFISLSGWSGISAGCCALVGAWLAHQRIQQYYQVDYMRGNAIPGNLYNELMLIALFVFVMAAITAIFFSVRKSKQQGVSIWGESSKRLLWNTLLPMIAGGILILKMIQDNLFDYVAASCLIFYGLGLLNGSKFTLGEVRYLGYVQLLLGLLCLFFVRQGLIFWSLGFGVSHIVYGILMWNKYDRKQDTAKL